jgi:ABC-type cobalamin/Fe3+-siderophores transport system ATPase subunit
VTVLGMKGSGKTYLLKYLIKAARPTGTRRIIIQDTKQVGDFDEYPTVNSLKDLHKTVAANAITVYAPTPFEKYNPEYHESLYQWIFDRWNTCIVIDELTSIVQGNQTPVSYRDLTDRGRARHVSIWQGNQKPVFIPHAALSEADHFFVFDLLVKSDREKVASILGNKVLTRPPDPHGFWYYHKSLKDPVYFPGIKL